MQRAGRAAQTSLSPEATIVKGPTRTRIANERKKPWRGRVLALAVLVLFAGFLRVVRRAHSVGPAENEVWGVQVPYLPERIVIFQAIDYSALYAGGWCMVHHCDPYSVPTLDAVLRAHGVHVKPNRWVFQLPIYPPTTLLLMSPLSALPYATSLAVWNVLQSAVWTLGLACAFYGSPLLSNQPRAARIAAVIFAFSLFRFRAPLMVGNPALIAGGLLLFAMTDRPDRRRALHALALAVATVLKPPLAMPYVALLCVRNRPARQTAMASLALSAVFAACTVAFAAQHAATAHWLSGLQANLALGQSPGVSMNANFLSDTATEDPMLHLQYLFGYWTSSATSHVLGLLGAGLLGLWLAWSVLKTTRRGLTPWAVPMDDSHYCAALAGVTMWMYLPVYHRVVDLCMLMFVVLWAIRFLSEGALQRRVWISLVLVYILSWQALYRFRWVIDSAAAHPVRAFVYYRGDPALVLLLALVVLSCVSSASRMRFPEDAAG